MCGCHCQSHHIIAAAAASARWLPSPSARSEGEKAISLHPGTDRKESTPPLLIHARTQPRHGCAETWALDRLRSVKQLGLYLFEGDGLDGHNLGLAEDLAQITPLRVN